MKYLQCILFITLVGCNGTPYIPLSDNPSNEEIQANKAFFDQLDAKNQKDKVLDSETVLVEESESAMSFEEFQKAKAENSQEYQDFLEYQQYLEFIKSQEK